MRLTHWIGAIAMLAAIGTARADAPADASFGQTVTSDVKLSGNLSGSGSGLVIGADGITIDLNGYTISSTDGTGYGIDNTGGYDGVTIRNGAVEGFQEGVRSVGGDDLTLQDLAIDGASGPAATTGVVHVLASSGLTIDGCEVSVATQNLGPHTIRLDSVLDVVVCDSHVAGGFVGISFFSVDFADADNPTNGVIKDCLVEGCIIGIILANTTDAVVKDNVVRDADDGGGAVALAGTQGIRIGFGLPLNAVQVVGNECHDVGIGILGLSTGPLTELVVKDNHCYDSNRGLLFVSTHDSQIKGNDAHDNELFGLAFNACDGNEIVGNKANDNGLRGLALVFGADDNLIKDNQCNGNGVEGLTLFLGANLGNEIVDNEATGNGVWDLFHNAESTPNTWADNDYDSALGDDIE